MTDELMKLADVYARMAAASGDFFRDDLDNSRSHQSKTRAALQAALEAKAKEIERLKELLAGQFTDGAIRYANGFIGIEGFIAPMLIEMFAAQFKESHAENYLEMSFTSSQILPSESFVIRVQKVAGKTPHALRLEAEQQRDALQSKLDAAQAQEPVAWVTMGQVRFTKPTVDVETYTPLYASPVVQQAQVPVAYIHRQGNHWEVSERNLLDDEKARGWTEEPLYTSPTPRQPLTPSEQVNGLAWAVSRWRDEVSNRPLVNKNRRSLDDTWRQVIRYFGGNPDQLCGPSHDALVANGIGEQQP